MRSFVIGDLLHPEEANGGDGFMIRGEVPRFLWFSANVASTTLLLAAKPATRYRVHGLTVGVATSAVNFGLYAGSASMMLGAFNCLSHAVVTLPFNPVGWCQTDYSQMVNFFETAAAVVNGVLIYVEIP